ncbi:hypothetical protein PAPJP_156 [Pseudomonas phage PAP-JP]|uniref:Uncharacterized protein n=1 Tax=Pseudomonas phage PAP-JP TaxID=2583508 RepID=A0A5C1K6S8_9CAUD|nr:hypothetical protein PAPJP_156 [Pseudomonas phage PAP-JP]
MYEYIITHSVLDVPGSWRCEVQRREVLEGHHGSSWGTAHVYSLRYYFAGASYTDSPALSTYFRRKKARHTGRA